MRRSKRHLFYYFLIPYLLFLLLLLTMGFSLFLLSKSAVSETVYNNNRAILNQSRVAMDTGLREISFFLERIRARPEIVQLKYARDPFSGKEILRVMDARDMIMDNRLWNDLVYNYFLFFEKSRLILTPLHVYEYEEYYQASRVYGDLNFQEWEEIYLNERYSKTILPMIILKEAPKEDLVTRKIYYSEEHRILPFIHTTGLPGISASGLVVLMDYDRIEELFSGVDFSEGGAFFIIDTEGTVLNVTNGNRYLLPGVEDLVIGGLPDDGFRCRCINGIDFLITFTVSEYNGYTYAAVQPEKLVLSKVHHIRDSVWGSVIVFLIIGLIFSLYFARRNSLPLNKVFERLNEQFAEQYGRPENMKGVGDTMRDIMKRNLALKNEIKAQTPLIRASLFARLFYGAFTSSKEIEILFRANRVDITGNRFCAVVFTIDPRESVEGAEEGMDIRLVLLNNIIRDCLGLASPLIHHQEENSLIWLYSFSMDKGNDESLEENECKRLTLLVNRIAEECRRVDMALSVTAGRAYDSLLDIHRSCQEAKIAGIWLEGRADSPLLFYQDLGLLENGISYPPETESRLINLVRSGNRDETNDLLDKICDENLIKRSLTPAKKRILLYNLSATLLKINNQLDIDSRELEEIVEEIDVALEQMSVPDEILQRLGEGFLLLCDRIRERQKSHNSRLRNEVIDFIDREFGNSQICLDLVAGKFSITPVYLSRFFKEQTGQYFSEHLENLRMEEACRRLAKTTLPISSIAERVGYSNLTSFARAFKRRHGVSASEYRNSGHGTG